VRGRGLGSQSSGPHLLVTGCTRTKQTDWVEDQFTVTSSSGIRNRDKRVTDIDVRELKRAKPVVWGYIQAREVWSSEEEANMRTGHFWICKIARYSDGDRDLVVDLWLHRVTDDTSGLTLQEWDPSEGSDDTSVPVAILVNSSELCAANFPLEEVRSLQLDTVVHGGRRTRGAEVRSFRVRVTVRLYSPWKTTMTSGQDVSEF
jgi:hypothetical protein